MFHYSKNNSGFTIIELMVTISIVAAILTVVVLNQSKYTDNIAVSGLADEIGLTLTQAQIYGTGVREFTPGSNDFTSSYGLTFSLLDDTGSPTAYLYYADRDLDGMYDGDWGCSVGGTSECLERIDITRGVSIKELCVVPSNGNNDCITAQRIDISFKRPDTDAQLTFFNGGGSEFAPSNMRGARITLISPEGTERSVTVYKTGQISVQ